nr:MOSC domain-containing protein [Cellulomonas sp. APG4]
MLSDVVGRDVRLVWLDDPTRRSVSPSHGGRSGEVLSLADTAPLLLTTVPSLRRLEQWGRERYAERYAACGREAGPRPAPLAMERFRANVVVDGGLEPFVEDGWTHVTIGALGFRVSELCDRCPIPGIDPETRQVTAEPLRALARHRRRDGRTWFGVRLVPEATGRLAVGDAVTAMSAP